MIRKINIAGFLTLFFLLGTSLFAQSAPVTGKVMLKKKDGTTVPVEGATVQPYQVDIKSSAPADKTDKKGNFSFAGLKVGARYVLSISAPGTKAGYFPNVKAGDTGIVINVEEGDGKAFTEEEIRSAIAAGPGTGSGTQKPAEMTAEQKKAQAEYEAKVKEVESKNQRAQKVNEIVNASLSEGNAAYQAKNYDLAITKYTEGVQADPDFAGSAPVLSNNKGAALTARAIQTYNQNAKSTDATAKLAAMNAVKKDFSDAVAAYKLSIDVLKTANPGDVDPKVAETARLNALRGVKEAFRLMAATEQVDPALTATAKEVFPEYISVETEAAKKDEAKIILADVYRVAGDSENAVAAYRAVLETSPDNIDAMAGLGFSLVNMGYVNNDKAQLQEGANFLQKFATAAPDTNKYKADAVGLIQTLKAEQNVTPVKSTGGRKKN
jgi:tetratricopeptide (TPR) repeat protein